MAKSTGTIIETNSQIIIAQFSSAATTPAKNTLLHLEGSKGQESLFEVN